MAKTITKELPLRQMREDAGLSLVDVASQMSQLLERPITPQYIRLLEYRGTGLYEHISAFSRVYQQPIERVADAAKAP